MQKDGVIASTSQKLKLYEQNYSVHYLGVSSSCICSKNLEALPVWLKVQDLYGSQKSKIYFHAKRIKYEATTMARVN